MAAERTRFARQATPVPVPTDHWWAEARGPCFRRSGLRRRTLIELAVREQLEGGDLQGDETLDATATVTVAGLSRDVVVTGQISLA
jgi:hypothetical protein